MFDSFVAVGHLSGGHGLENEALVAVVRRSTDLRKQSSVDFMLGHWVYAEDRHVMRVLDPF